MNLAIMPVTNYNLHNRANNKKSVKNDVSFGTINLHGQALPTSKLNEANIILLEKAAAIFKKAKDAAIKEFNDGCCELRTKAAEKGLSFSGWGSATINGFKHKHNGVVINDSFKNDGIPHTLVIYGKNLYLKEGEAAVNDFEKDAFNGDLNVHVQDALARYIAEYSHYNKLLI